jgi:quercetin dioxygenase-like cupin family protein
MNTFPSHGRFTDVEYAAFAIRLYRQLGWKGETRDMTVKLIHPEGREFFETHGVVFIDIPSYSDEFYMRLCVLYPNQRMRLHYHNERAEVFKVIAGTMNLITIDVSRLIQVGDYLSPKVGEKHGVSTDEKGCAYVGICHRDHMKDVHWEEKEQPSLITDVSKRMTIVDISKLPHDLEDYAPFKVFDTDKSILLHLNDAHAESDRVNK